MHPLHGAGLLEPPVPHLDLGEFVLRVGRPVGTHVLEIIIPFQLISVR